MYSNPNMSNQNMPNKCMINQNMPNKCMINQPRQMRNSSTVYSANTAGHSMNSGCSSDNCNTNSSGRRSMDSCGAHPEHMHKCMCTLAMASVPMQKFENLYDAETGFCKGTIFMGLDKPFTGGNKKCR